MHRASNNITLCVQNLLALTITCGAVICFAVPQIKKLSMKKAVLFFFVAYLFLIHAYGQSSKLTITPVIGIRGHTNGLPGLKTAAKPLLITAPMLGFDVQWKDFPITLSVQKDWNAEFVFYPNSPAFDFAINQIWTENNLLLRYPFSKYYNVSLGYYRMQRENSLQFDYGLGATVREYRGILLGCSRQFDWLNVELRSKINIRPFAALVGLELYSVVLSYRFDKKTRETANSFNEKFQLAATIGTRFFPIKGVRVLRDEVFGKIGISPTLGIELLHRKSNLSANIEKDVWFSLNGGSTAREIKGYIASSFIGVKYHFLLNNQRHFRLGLGYSFIYDMDKRGILPFASRDQRIKLNNYQVKGIGMNISYELIPNTDIEIKHTFPIKSLDESLFNPIRLSAGIIYRLSDI